MVNYKLKEKVYEANMDQMLTMGKDKILNLPQSKNTYGTVLTIKGLRMIYCQKL